MKQKNQFLSLIVGGIVVVCIGVLYVNHVTTSSPPNFPVGKNFTVNESESLRSISKRLESEGYVYSALAFRIWVSSLGKDRHIKIGGYVFNEPHTLGSVVLKFVSGNPDLPLLSVTIPEGSTSFEIANLVRKALPTISIDIFGEMISKYEGDGRLFPSTYFLLPSYTEELIVKLMLDTFDRKTKGTMDEKLFVIPLRSRNDVLSLAAILEGEAKNEKDMAIVAGILIKRLNIGMPLQVDVAMETYKAKGLPSVPINNPGLVAISAALHPVVTPYLYYITGNDGAMYYAKTFDEHKRNIKKYLR